MINDVIVFTLDGERYGLPIQVVQRVIRAVEVTPLPQSPANVLGVISIQGDIVPVLSLRRLLRLPEHALRPEDEFLIVQTGRRRLALVADAVTGVLDYAAQDLTTAEKILPGLDFVGGVIRANDGLILIMDLDLFLSPHEERMLEDAIASSPVP